MLCGRRASSKSDVWAFGVTAWEIFTLGATPYAQVPTQDVAGEVCRGLRLPGTCPQFGEDLYALMVDCWQVDPDERPSFQQVVDRLQHLLSMEHATVRREN